MRRLTAHWLGRADYAATHALQQRVVEARKADAVGDTVLLLEHPNVITLGRAAKRAHILAAQDELSARGYQVHETGRGGDVTFHGPGQLVAYPIVNLKPDRQDVRRFVADLEETMIRVCADYGIAAQRVAALNGAWVRANKIGAVGVRISQWVTMHGFALNVSTDLAAFAVIVPCGIQDRGVTSLAQELGRALPLAEVYPKAAQHLAAQLGAELVFSPDPPLEHQIG
jgi:lipoyl(octanoyl) transferase